MLAALIRASSNSLADLGDGFQPSATAWFQSFLASLVARFGFLERRLYDSRNE